MNEDELLNMLCAAQAQNPQREFLSVSTGQGQRFVIHPGLPDEGLLLDAVYPLLNRLASRRL